MFLGRKKELKKFNQLWEKGKFEALIVYGRRRVGKTTLINEFCKDKKTIFYAASESSSSENLQAFSQVIGEALGNKGQATYNSYHDLFVGLGEIAKTQRIALVIDEYPYLAKAEPAISSLLQNAIDSIYKNTKMFLILCGSSMSFMENQVLGYQSPLYGRRTAQFKIEPFTYYETAQWFPTFKNEDKALLYGITGGIPLYVELMSGYSTVKEAMLSEFFDKNAYLYEEPNNLLKQELREPQNYNAIVAAIATGSSRMNEIATKVSMETAVCSKYLNKLMELGIIRKEYPLGEKTSRKIIYQISDQMFRFWYRFVPQNMSAIVSGRIEQTFSTAVEPHLPHYMGAVFEELAKQYILHYDETLPFELGEIGQWWGTNKEKKCQVQLDMVVSSPDKRSFIFGECKYKNQPVDLAILENLRTNAETFPEKVDAKWYYLFSKSGFTSQLEKEAKEGNVRLLTLEQMMPK